MQLMWTVYDCLLERPIGFWTDICSAEEFCYENEDSDTDVWAVFPLDEVISKK